MLLTLILHYITIILRQSYYKIDGEHPKEKQHIRQNLSYQIALITLASSLKRHKEELTLQQVMWSTLRLSYYESY